MAGERDREAEGEDPFEDLDKFFSPIEDVDWPGEARASEPRREGPPEPTAEMTGEEWRRLRDALGDEGEGVEVSAPPPMFEPADDPAFDEKGFVASIFDDAPPFDAAPSPDPTADEPLEASVPPAARDDDVPPGELTLDDLKKAPPEYADLPGPRDAAPAAPVQAPEPDARASTPEAPAGPAVRPAARSAGTGRSEPGAPHVEVLGRTPEEPPSLAEVEAMADNLAQEFKVGSGEGDAVPETTGTDEPVGEEPAGRRPEGPPGGQADVPPREPAPVPDIFDDDLLGEFEPEPPPESITPPGPRTIKVGQPEDLMGPAWEDPTAKTITREPVAESAPRIRNLERNLPAAVLTAAVLVAAALISIAIAPVAFASVAAIVLLIALAELYATMQRHGYHPATALGLAIGALMLAAAYFRGEQGMLLILAIGVVATFLWFMAAAPKAREGLIANVAATLFGIVYVPFFGGFYLVLLSATDSRALVLSVLGVTFLYDVVAFFVGRYWGNRPLAPRISPKKSWEGLLGATAATIVAAALLPTSMGPVTSVTKALGIGLIVVVFAPIGDLAESALKRDLGVKDMGSILPGHGGMLDRIDSAILVAPAAFYFIRLIAG